MASPTDLKTQEVRLPDVAPTPPEQWYDRSSIRHDAMVMIDEQTEADYFRYAPESRFCELIDGVVYMPSPVMPRHQQISQFWAVLLDGYGEERGIGTVLMGPAVLRVAPNRNLEPDVFVAPPGAQPLPPSGLAMGEALFVVEVLSPGNRAHDLKRKAAVYREARIPEIVFVDDRDHILIVDRLVGNVYETVRMASGHWISTVIDGFWLDVSWLWHDPLPSRRACVEAILAGPPA